MEATEENDLIIPSNSGIFVSKSNSNVVLRLHCKTKEEFLQWKEEYENLNYVTYRFLRGQGCEGQKVLFKCSYRCHRNTVPKYNKSKKPAEKHTDCPHKMSVTIKAVSHRNRSADTFLPDYPTMVEFSGAHNHSIQSAESLKFRDVGPEVRFKFLELFKAGNGPSHALELHKRDLMEQYDEDYQQVACDSAQCPSLGWVQRLYTKQYKQSRYKINENKCKDLLFQKLENGLYKVKSSGSDIWYTVDPHLGLCECDVGRNGGPCKHQHVISLQEKISCPNTLHADSEAKKTMFCVATGNNNIPQGGFGPLCLQSDQNLQPQSECEVVEIPNCSLPNDSLELAESLTVNSAESSSMLDQIVADLRSRKQRNESEYDAAIRAFHKKYFALPTDSEIVTSLHSFGSLDLKKKNAGQIAVQSTIARRRLQIATKRCLQSGRRKKFTGDHHYSKQRGFRRKIKAPHSLSTCVSENISLGQKH